MRFHRMNSGFLHLCAEKYTLILPGWMYVEATFPKPVSVVTREFVPVTAQNTAAGT
jgi:hypothetical protein